MPADHDDILLQQIAYYRARAQEYDEWFYRQGRYDHGADANAQWFREVEEVRQALRALGPADDILELACGTGIWTEELARIGRRVTALDASDEVIAINRGKLPGAPVTYVQADLFEWEPERAYDLVFFGFWLSHVPPETLAAFLQKVARAARPGGQVFMVDSRRHPLSGAKGTLKIEDEIYHTRQLNDGREFTIIKIYYEPDDLARHFDAAGFDLTARATAQFLVYAQGKRR